MLFTIFLISWKTLLNIAAAIDIKKSNKPIPIKIAIITNNILKVDLQNDNYRYAYNL